VRESDSRSDAPQFLAFCDREGNPTLSAELVASYRVSLVGEGKSSSTVGVHPAAIKALTRAAVMAGLMPAEVAAAINDVKGAPRRGNRIGNWLIREQAQELLSLPDRESRQKFLLGHASIPTTEQYLGAEQDFISAVNGNLGLER
jgi:hypothetical protein